MLTTAQAAAALKISRQRVLALIASGRLPAQKHGRDWMIEEDDLELVKVRRPGRPVRDDGMVQIGVLLTPEQYGWLKGQPESMSVTVRYLILKEMSRERTESR